MNEKASELLMWIKIGVLIAAGFLCYVNTFQSTFHYDDEIFIVKNENIRDITNFKALWHSQPHYSRIVAIISFALNYHFGGLNSLYYHVTNFLIHLLASGFVWWLGLLLFQTPPGRAHPFFSQRQNISFFAALFFLIHPAQTQAVTYVSQRFESLATMFYVFSVCLFLRGRINVHDRQKGAGIFFFAMAVMFVFGLFTKEVVMTLPFMLVFVELFLFEARWIKRVHFVTLFAFCALFCVLASFLPGMMKMSLWGHLLNPLPSSSHYGDVITFGSYFWTQFRVWVVLLRLLVLPLPGWQNLEYDFPLSYSFWDWPVPVCVFAVLAGLWLAFGIRRKDRLVSFGLFWLYLTFSINFVPRIYVIFEHKLYLVSVGFYFATAIILFRLVKRSHRLVVLTTIVVFLMGLTVSRNAVWKDDVTLWSDVIRKSPGRPSANFNLGRAYQEEQGDLERAFEYYNKTLAIDRFHAKALASRASIFEKRGEMDKAQRDFDLAIQLKPRFWEALNNRGAFLARQGKYEQASEDFTRAIAIKKNFHEAYVNRGQAYRFLGKYDEAFADMSRAIFWNPKYKEAYLKRGALQIMQQRYPTALGDLNKALEIDPHCQEALMNKGTIYYKQGKIREALDYFNRVIAQNGEYRHMAYYNRFLLYRTTGHLDLALQDARHLLSGGYSLPPGAKKELERFAGSR